MLFERVLTLADTREKYAQRLEHMGMSREQALHNASKTSVSDIAQICQDLNRVPHIDVILGDKPIGSPDRYIDVNGTDFLDEASVDNFISLLSSNNPYLYSYLSAYLHQGGFTFTAETLLIYFFRFELNQEEQLLVGTKNRKSRFIIHPDGSLTFEECFDIHKLSMTDETVYKPECGSIASVKLRSKIAVVENQEGIKELVHTFEDINIKAQDKAAKKMFDDPRNPFARFIDWAIDVIQMMFSQAARERNQTLNHLPKPGMKL